MLYFLHISSSASCYCKPVFIILHALVMPRHVYLYFISYLIPWNHLCNRFIASCYGPLLILRTHDPRSYPYRGNININNNGLIVYTPLIINNDSIYQSIVEPGIELLWDICPGSTLISQKKYMPFFTIKKQSTLYLSHISYIQVGLYTTIVYFHPLTVIKKMM